MFPESGFHVTQSCSFWNVAPKQPLLDPPQKEGLCEYKIQKAQQPLVLVLLLSTAGGLLSGPSEAPGISDLTEV